MFEDSTFESNGRIRTRSRFWMIATLTLNGSILLGLVLIPLIYPEALPRQAIAFLMAAPPPTPTPPKPQAPPQTAQAPRPPSEMVGGELLAPPRIPPGIFIAKDKEPPAIDSGTSLDSSGSSANDVSKIFPGHGGGPVVRSAVTGPVPVSTGVEAALLLRKTVPVYPAICREARIQGTVTLQATISKGGTIENLRVVSGPPMLQQAAMDAVKTWVYRPYLLDGQPVEVETTVNVIFSLGR
jgi:protein TonB